MSSLNYSSEHEQPQLQFASSSERSPLAKRMRNMSPEKDEYLFPKKALLREHTCLSTAASTRPRLPVSSSSTAARHARSPSTSCSWQYVRGGPFHCSAWDQKHHRSKERAARKSSALCALENRAAVYCQLPERTSRRGAALYCTLFAPAMRPLTLARVVSSESVDMKTVLYCTLYCTVLQTVLHTVRTCNESLDLGKGRAVGISGHEDGGQILPTEPLYKVVGPRLVALLVADPEVAPAVTHRVTSHKSQRSRATE